MIKYVYSIEYFYNCPVHDGGTEYGLKKAETLDEVLDFALKNLNEYLEGAGFINDYLGFL